MIVAICYKFYIFTVRGNIEANMEHKNLLEAVLANIRTEKRPWLERLRDVTRAKKMSVPELIGNYPEFANTDT